MKTIIAILAIVSPMLFGLAIYCYLVSDLLQENQDNAYKLGCYSMAAGVDPSANPYTDEDKAEQWLMGWIAEANAKRK